MTPETIIDNEYITLWYHPDTQIVHHEIHKFIYGDAFRDALMTGAELLKTRNACKWLSNDRGNSAMPKDDVEWLMENFISKAIKAGWRHWAIVSPKSMVGRMSIDSSREYLSEHGLNVMVFDDEKSAMDWLISQ